MLRSLSVSLVLLLATSLPAAGAVPALVGLTYSGDQAALDELDRDLSAAGKDVTKLAALETRLLTLLRRTDATFAARQQVAQRLGAVLAQSAAKAKADDYKPLPAMLVDDRESDVARLALDRAPGAAIDALFVSALDKTTGRTRLGIIDTIARRRLAAAVPRLAKLLKDAEAATVAAAARALGEIADQAAVAALQTLPEPSATAVAAAKLVAASRLPASEASPLLREVEKSARSAAHRTAAFRTSLDVDPTGAVKRIVTALDGSDWELKQAALEALLKSPAPDLVATLTAKLPAWDAPTQAGVIAAFERRAEVAALPAIVEASTHADAEVRAAAISALGVLPGHRDIATLLAKAAAGTNKDDAKLARLSLARLNGPDVNAAVLAGAERGEPGLRVVYLEQIALRNLTEGLPLLLKMRTDPDATVRIAAVGALGEIAPPSEQQALIDWTIAAKDEAEQNRALRSVVNVALRDRSTDGRGRTLFAAIEKAPTDAALRLLPALGRVGGAASAECAARLALRNDKPIADAAVAALGRWTDSTALPALATVAGKATLPEVRAAAVDAALVSFERTRELWSVKSSEVVAALLAATTDTAARKRLVTLLNRASDKVALERAASLKTDAALGADAREAVEVVTANLAGAPALRAFPTTSNVKNMIDGKTDTRWNVPTAGEEWVEISFKSARPVHRITLDQTGRGAEFPESYEVYVTDDLAAPGAARVTGKGRQNKTVIDLPAGTRGRYVIIKNVAERKESQWSICELFVD